MVDEFPKKNKLLRFRFTYFMPCICAAIRDIQTIQMKPILLCVWAERDVLGSAKTALKFKYEI